MNKSRTNRYRTRAAALLAVAITVAVSISCTRGGPTGGANANEYGRSGPNGVATSSDSVTQFYYPSNIGQSSAKHAVILWGNGTFTTPTVYDGLLRHWASFGFIVAAAKTSNAGTGQEMLQGLDTLTTRNGQAGNPFYNKVNLSKVGSSGHSQGGFGAVQTGKDPRVTTVFPIEGPGVPAGTTPVLFLDSQNGLGPPISRTAYPQMTNRPAAWAQLAGADHLTVLGNAGWFRVPATAWAKWQLDGDTHARDMFVGPNCGLCNNPVWSSYQANALLR
jgi:hypothetical protein